MSTVTGAVVAVAVLGGAGAVPALALIGPRWLLVPVAPLAGSVVAAVAAAAVLGIGGSVGSWYLVIAGASAAAIVVRWTVRPATRPWADPAARPPIAGRVCGLGGAVGVVAATAWALTALRTPSVGFDARTVWMLHATWYMDGHRVALAALRNPALSFAHTAYPPLVGGSVAVSWVVTGDHGYRFGVVVVALLNACATMTAATMAIEAARAAPRPTPAPDPSGATDPGRTPSWLLPLAGSATAVLLVLVAFAVAGPFATNGYADMLWAVCAVGAVGYGLVLPEGRANLGVALVLAAVAGLTKDEGYLTTAGLVVLITVRVLASRRRRSAPAWRPLAAGLAGVGALAVWPVLTRLLHAAPNVEAPGPRRGTDVSRFHQVVSSVVPHLHVLGLALPVAVVGALFLRRTRHAMGMGADGWAWAALCGGLAVVVLAYVTGPGDVRFWLATSVHRTTFFPALCAWWVTATWVVVGTAQFLTPAPYDPAPVVAPSAGAGAPSTPRET